MKTVKRIAAVLLLTGSLSASALAFQTEKKADLKEHQQGKTDYLTFIGLCAKLGIEKWEVYMDKMTCTYYDKAGNEILVEQIPQ